MVNATWGAAMIFSCVPLPNLLSSYGHFQTHAYTDNPGYTQLVMSVNGELSEKKKAWQEWQGNRSEEGWVERNQNAFKCMHEIVMKQRTSIIKNKKQVNHWPRCICTQRDRALIKAWLCRCSLWSGSSGCVWSIFKSGSAANTRLSFGRQSKQ